MEKLARALLVVTALALLVSWTVWASDQVAAGGVAATTGSVLKGGKFQDARGDNDQRSAYRR